MLWDILPVPNLFQTSPEPLPNFSNLKPNLSNLKPNLSNLKTNFYQTFLKMSLALLWVISPIPNLYQTSYKPFPNFSNLTNLKPNFPNFKPNL